MDGPLIKMVEYIQKELDNNLKPKRDKCNALIEKGPQPETKAKLEAALEEYSAYIDRAAICLDILRGTAFAIKDDVLGLIICIPKDPKKARLIMEAEKLGARVEGLNGKNV